MLRFHYTATVYREPTGKQVNTVKNCFTYMEYLFREQAHDCFLFYGTGNDCWNYRECLLVEQGAYRETSEHREKLFHQQSICLAVQ